MAERTLGEGIVDVENEVVRTRNDIAALGTMLSGEMLHLKQQVDEVNEEVLGVKSDVKGVKDDVYSFKVRFEEFVDDMEKKNNITHAQGQMVILNQEIEKQFGLYEDVRNNLLGILQAVDTGLVSKKVITNSTEELMLGTPRYWLSPSLIALAAWLNNNQGLANKALSEGLKRNLIKTELIFTLISNRLKRQDASFAWLSKYFENQNPQEMPQETLILVNAYTDGVFGPDSHGECIKQISAWLDYLSKQPETVKNLENQWVKKIQVMRSEEDETIPFKYLEEYCEEFPMLMNLLNYAKKHQIFLDYLTDIINATKEKKSYTEELDDILYKLVNEYDADEFELRRKHKMCELIIKYEGDKKLAEADFDANVVTMFKDKVTFFDILVNAATKEDSSPNLRKLSILLMKEWIINAHQDFTAQYRAQYLSEITMKMDNWTHKTGDGSNEEEMCKSYDEYLKDILNKELRRTLPSFWIIGIICVCLWWLISAPSGASITFFIVSLIALAFNIVQVIKKRNQLREAYKEKSYNGTSIIKAFCAEFVDWQKAYKDADSVAEKVPEFLKKYDINEFATGNASNKILI